MLIEDEKIKKVIIGTHLNLIFIICQECIYVVWMSKTDQNSRRLIKVFPQNNILDLMLVKEKLFLMKQDSIEQSYMKYFDNGQSKIIFKETS